MTKFKSLLQKLNQILLTSICCVAFLGLFLSFKTVPAAASQDEIIVEWLQFSVPEDEQALFITKEIEIWDPVNRRSPDYIGKELWQNDKQPDQLTMINYWHGKNHRQNITPAMVEKAEKDFDIAVGKTYKILESKTFKQLFTDSSLLDKK